MSPCLKLSWSKYPSLTLAYQVLPEPGFSSHPPPAPFPPAPTRAGLPSLRSTWAGQALPPGLSLARCSPSLFQRGHLSQLLQSPPSCPQRSESTYLNFLNSLCSYLTFALVCVPAPPPPNVSKVHWAGTLIVSLPVASWAPWRAWHPGGAHKYGWMSEHRSPDSPEENTQWSLSLGLTTGG